MDEGEEPMSTKEDNQEGEALDSDMSCITEQQVKCLDYHEGGGICAQWVLIMPERNNLSLINCFP